MASVPAPAPGKARRRLKAFILKRYSTRLHMSLILMAMNS